MEHEDSELIKQLTKIITEYEKAIYSHSRNNYLCTKEGALALGKITRILINQYGVTIGSGTNAVKSFKSK